MDFSKKESRTKAWKDIWGAGQGVGTMKDIKSVASLVNEIEEDYSITKKRVCR